MPVSGCRLPIVLGSQVAAFSGRSLFQAFNQPWTVDNRAVRMGVRLTGPALHGALTGIISEGIPLGAVQIPSDGQPIVLMNDRQTIGGYPRLGAITPIACATLAQCLPGTKVWLTPISASPPSTSSHGAPPPTTVSLAATSPPSTMDSSCGATSGQHKRVPGARWGSPQSARKAGAPPG